MSTKPLKVGGEIDSFCTKCKLVLNHRIVSMLNGKPAKVMCLTCDKPEVRVYRPHAPGAKPAAGARASAGGSTSRASTSTKAAARVSSAARAEAEQKERERTWEKAIAGRAMGDFKAYRISSSFQEGDLLRHSRFGDGVVTRVLDARKIEVLFKEEAKTLAHGTPV